ncbi:MAG: hypothetical protein IK081_07255 [Lachnospiraceae bacterium]|nr:hypothetical protein [Lachnospiraceae bacterium]
MSEEISKKRVKCQNCGAEAITEICPYCGSRTGIDTANTELDYPEFAGKDLTTVNGREFILFGGFWVLIIVTLLSALMVMQSKTGESFGFFFNFIFPSIFFVLGMVFIVMGIRQLLERALVMKRGETVKGICYGYAQDTVKLLIPTEKGPQYLFVQKRKEYRQFVVNDTVKLKMLENKYVVLDEEI